MAANAPQPRDEGVGAEKGGALPAARVKIRAIQAYDIAATIPLIKESIADRRSAGSDRERIGKCVPT
jgi:hypothetical protein